MTVRRVPADKIEGLVGRKRHPTEHYAKADGNVLNVLHSEQCLAAFDDLRECPFSLAMGRGIRHDLRFEEGPTVITIDDDGFIKAWGGQT